MNSMEQDYQKVGAFAREIVAKRIAITQAVGQGLALLVLFHVITVDQSAVVTKWVAGGIVAVASAVGILWTRDGTTPADPALAPKTATGEPLVPASTVPAPAAPEPAPSAPTAPLPIPEVGGVVLGEPEYAPAEPAPVAQ